MWDKDFLVEEHNSTTLDSPASDGTVVDDQQALLYLIRTYVMKVRMKLNLESSEDERLESEDESDVV